MKITSQLHVNEEAIKYFESLKHLEKVEMYMEEAKTNIETEEWNVAISSIDTSAYMLNQIKERYEFSLKNIF